MNEMVEIYIRLFLIVPLLLYLGYCITKKQTHSTTLLFHWLVLFMIAITLFFHLKYLLKIIQRIFNNEQYQKEFGVFLLFLAVFILVLCLNDLYFLQEKNKKKTRKSS